MAVYVIGVRTTGQTPGYLRMTKDPKTFPTHWSNDPFAEGCLDAPLYLPTGQTMSVLESCQDTWGQDPGIVRDGTYWGLL